MFASSFQPNMRAFSMQPGPGSQGAAPAMGAGQNGGLTPLSTGGNPGQGQDGFNVNAMAGMMGIMGMMLQLMGMFMLMLGQSGLGTPANPTGESAIASEPAATSSGTPTGSSQGATVSAPDNATVSSPSAGSPAGQLSPARSRPGQWTRPNQMKAFDASVRNSACGPAAAIGLARSLGINASPQQALQLAGGNFSAAGMGQAQVAKLATDLGAPAYNEEGAINWTKVRNEAQQGKKVVLHFEGHYYFVEGYDPATGKFDLGTSVTQFANVPKDANGQPISQYTQDEIKNVLIPALARTLPSLTPTERGAIYLR